MLFHGAGRPHHPGIEQHADRFFVRPIRRSEGNGDRDAGGVGEVMPLGAGLGAIGGIGAGFFPHPAGLCGGTHRLTATATRARRRGHSAAAAGARSLPSSRGRPSAETAGGASSPTRTRTAQPSTDTRCAARRGRRRGCAGAASIADRRSAGTPRSATASRSGSTDRPARATRLARLVAAPAVALSPPPSPPLHGVARHGAWRLRTTWRAGDPALNHLRDRL
jgi:hypothetical protein